MLRRAVLTPTQREALLALPSDDDDAELARHYTLSDEDLRAIRRRRGEANRLGFALQLCALRYPGRLLHRGEVIPERMMTFIGRQLGIDGAARGAVRRRRSPRGGPWSMSWRFHLHSVVESRGEGHLSILSSFAIMVKRTEVRMMRYVSATEAKQRLAAVLDAAQREPVTIRRQNRDVAVVLSPEEYDKLTRLNVEEFRRFCDEVGARAASRGLTEEKLTELLAGHG
jgi:prevent-host-death family protein